MPTASHLAMAGVDLYTIKDFLGHWTKTMMERVAHLSKSHKEKAMSVFHGMVGAVTQQQLPAMNNNTFIGNRIFVVNLAHLTKSR
jgi:hypothetical protein